MKTVQSARTGSPKVAAKKTKVKSSSLPAPKGAMKKGTPAPPPAPPTGKVKDKPVPATAPAKREVAVDIAAMSGKSKLAFIRGAVSKMFGASYKHVSGEYDTETGKGWCWVQVERLSKKETKEHLLEEFKRPYERINLALPGLTWQFDHTPAPGTPWPENANGIPYWLVKVSFTHTVKEKKAAVEKPETPVKKSPKAIAPPAPKKPLAVKDKPPVTPAKKAIPKAATKPTTKPAKKGKK